MKLGLGQSAGGQLAIALLVTAIVSLMILPLPPFLIDMLLSVNIGLSVLLLMAALYAPSAIALTSFPSLLLFTTLFRLSLNITSTKAILLHADAGHIIDAFGNLVVGGNLLVGLTVFAIIAIVQFIVIAKGSERASEVSARFALDALPGAQMSIDAEVRAGTMTSDEARKKRSHLAMESQMHGSMDGAMKFVKGDAIAGLVITLVNIIAGIAVGVSYHGMTMAVAAQRFSVLSVGDAMVSQIPSLLISVAAGTLTTRVLDARKGRNDSLGQEVLSQLGSNPTPMLMASALLVCFSIVPGFPTVIFIGLAALLATAAWRQKRKGATAQSGSGEGQEVDPRHALPSLRSFSPKSETPRLKTEAPAFAPPLGLRLSTELASIVVAETLDAAFKVERAALQNEYGLPFPGMALWTTPDLEGFSYELMVQDVPVERGTVESDQRTPELVAKQLSAACMRKLAQHVHQFMGIQETQWILERLGQEYPGLVAEVQKVLPIQRIADVLRRLLEERVPIRSPREIMESLVQWGPKEKDVLVLTEYVRADLGRMIAYRARQGEDKLEALFLHTDLEQLIRQAIQPTPTGNFLTLPPERVKEIIDRIAEIAGDKPRAGLAVVTSMDIRRYVRQMLQSRIQWLNVYSYQELGNHIELVSAGRVEA